MINTIPDPNTLPDFYKNYVALVKDMNLIEALEQSIKLTHELISNLPETKGDYRYAPGKWSIKELLCHLLDAERVFAYRAMRFARNDATPLPGFDENEYAPQANAEARSLKQLADELMRLRLTTLDLFKGFTNEMLQRKGSANNSVISVVNIGYVIAGHETHHRNILNERYLAS